MSDIRDVSSAWVTVKKFLIPIGGKVINFLYIASLIWLLIVAVIGGMYIVVPGIKSCMDDWGWSKIFISEELKDATSEGEEASITLFIKYIIIKNLWLIGIVIGLRVIMFGYIFPST